LTLTGNGRLDVNYLDENLLYNAIDLANLALLENMLNQQDDERLPKFKQNKAFVLRATYDDNSLILYRNGISSYAEVTVDKEAPTVLNLTQDGTQLTQVVNRTGGSNITIRQSR
jgi:hypothetical protein